MSAFDPVAYLNATVFAYLKPSNIHGIGVFAIRDIPKDTEITDFHAPTTQEPFWISKGGLAALHPAVRKLVLDQSLSFDAGKIYVVSPNAVVILRSFMNHSRNSNTNGVKALRLIKRGQELTEDYNVTGLLSPISKSHYTFL